MEIASSKKPQCCGCSNQMIVREETVSAKDLSSVVMINHIHGMEETSFSKEEIEWQENRKRRKVKRLDFEVR
jgi:hypothetical protein|tara:strand:+ start:408 stop:623 length:216 start_codon:yes stop_codon:yes gene_type:complete